MTGLVAMVCDLSTLKTKAKRTQVEGKPELHSKTFSQKKKTPQNPADNLQKLRCSSVVEHMLSIHKAVGSTPNTTKKQVKFIKCTKTAPISLLKFHFLKSNLTIISGTMYSLMLNEVTSKLRLPLRQLSRVQLKPYIVRTTVLFTKC